MRRLAGLFLLAVVTIVGCKKQEAPAGSTVEVIDASKFFTAFSSAPPEAKALVDSVMASIQGSDLIKARLDLDRLAKTPGVTDAQQAAIKTLGDQLDKKIAATASPAAPK